MGAKAAAGSLKFFNAHLASKGIIIDASFIEAPRQRNEREQNQRIKNGERPEEFDLNPAVGRQKDSETHWSKKNKYPHSSN